MAKSRPTCLALRAFTASPSPLSGAIRCFPKTLQARSAGGSVAPSFLHLEALPFDVRKLAHFANTPPALPARHSRFAELSPSRLLNHALLGLLAAVIDESIQVLSGRGPLVTDI